MARVKIVLLLLSAQMCGGFFFGQVKKIKEDIIENHLNASDFLSPKLEKLFKSKPSLVSCVGNLVRAYPDITELVIRRGEAVVGVPKVLVGVMMDKFREKYGSPWFERTFCGFSRAKRP